jgi:hypothetical protein
MITKLGRVAALSALLVMFLFTAGAMAKVVKHNHNSGSSKAAAHLKKADGNYALEKKGKHSVSLDVKNHKVAGMKVKHDTKGDVAVKKYKSNKKMAELDGAPSEGTPAQADMGTVWIAYAYVDDDGNEEYYWYQAEEILDPSGAIDYVPLS